MIDKDGLPQFLIKMLVELEDFSNRIHGSKDQKKSMSSRNYKSMNTMRQKLRKYNKQYAKQIEEYRKVCCPPAVVLKGPFRHPKKGNRRFQAMTKERTKQSLKTGFRMKRRSLKRRRSLGVEAFGYERMTMNPLPRKTKTSFQTTKHPRKKSVVRRREREAKRKLQMTGQSPRSQTSPKKLNGLKNWLIRSWKNFWLSVGGAYESCLCAHSLMLTHRAMTGRLNQRKLKLFSLSQNLSAKPLIYSLLSSLPTLMLIQTCTHTCQLISGSQLMNTRGNL